MELPHNYSNKFSYPAAAASKPEGKERSERDELMQKFLDRLNPGRVDDGFRPLSFARLGKMLEGIPTDKLYPFYKECENARSFSKLFSWKLKQIKSQTP